jgi:predicted nucleic acid-binding protein
MIRSVKLPGDQATQNELRGRVVQMIEENGNVRVVVDAGIWVALLISKKRYQEIRFMVGETINLYIPPEAVHII